MSIPARRDECGHFTCHGHPACIYLTGTYTPAADVQIDHCDNGDHCTHHQQEPIR